MTTYNPVVAGQAIVAGLKKAGIDFVATFWGAIKAGFVPVPLNTLLSADIFAGLGGCGLRSHQRSV